MRDNDHSPGMGIQALTGNRGNPRIGESNLPAGLHRKVGNPHAEWSPSWTWGRALMRGEVLVAAGSTSELDNQTLAHEVRAILVFWLGVWTTVYGVPEA